MNQLRPVQIVGKTLVGLGRAGKSAAGADAVVCVSRPAKQLEHCSAPFHNRVLILERKEKLPFKPFLAERTHHERIEELMKRLVLRIMPELIPDEPPASIALNHAGLDLGERSGY